MPEKRYILRCREVDKNLFDCEEEPVNEPSPRALKKINREISFVIIVILLGSITFALSFAIADSLIHLVNVSLGIETAANIYIYIVPFAIFTSALVVTVLIMIKSSRLRQYSGNYLGVSYTVQPGDPEKL